MRNEAQFVIRSKSGNNIYGSFNTRMRAVKYAAYLEQRRGLRCRIVINPFFREVTCEDH